MGHKGPSARLAIFRVDDRSCGIRPLPLNCVIRSRAAGRADRPHLGIENLTANDRLGSPAEVKAQTRNYPSTTFPPEHTGSQIEEY